MYSAEALPLELPAPGPTATFRAAAGVGLVEVSAPQIVALEAAGLSEVGRIDFTPVAATSRHEAGAGVGAVDWTGVAPGVNRPYAAGVGQLDLAAVAPQGTKVFASGQGSIDFTSVAPGGSFHATAGQGLFDLTPLGSTATKAASLPADSWLLTPGSLAANISAASGLGLIEQVGVSPATTKVTGIESGQWLVASGQLAANFSAPLAPDSGLLAPVAPTAKHDAASVVGVIDVTLPAVGSQHAVAVASNQWTVASGQLAAIRVSPLAPGSWLLTPVSPGTTKPAAAGVGQWDLVPVAATVRHEAAVPSLALRASVVSPAASFGAAAGVGTIDVTPPALASAKGVELGTGVIDVLGKAPREPYGPVYSTACTLSQVGYGCELVTKVN